MDSRRNGFEDFSDVFSDLFGDAGVDLGGVVEIRGRGGRRNGPPAMEDVGGDGERKLRDGAERIAGIGPDFESGVKIQPARERASEEERRNRERAYAKAEGLSVINDALLAKADELRERIEKAVATKKAIEEKNKAGDAESGAPEQEGETDTTLVIDRFVDYRPDRRGVVRLGVVGFLDRDIVTMAQKPEPKRQPVRGIGIAGYKGQAKGSGEKIENVDDIAPEERDALMSAEIAEFVELSKKAPDFIRDRSSKNKKLREAAEAGLSQLRAYETHQRETIAAKAEDVRELGGFVDLDSELNKIGLRLTASMNGAAWVFNAVRVEAPKAETKEDNKRSRRERIREIGESEELKTLKATVAQLEKQVAEEAQARKITEAVQKRDDFWHQSLNGVLRNTPPNPSDAESAQILRKILAVVEKGNGNAAPEAPAAAAAD